MGAYFQHILLLVYLNLKWLSSVYLSWSKMLVYVFVLYAPWILRYEWLPGADLAFGGRGGSSPLPSPCPWSPLASPTSSYRWSTVRRGWDGGKLFVLAGGALSYAIRCRHLRTRNVRLGPFWKQQGLGCWPGRSIYKNEARAHNIPYHLREMLEALVWFWWIDETLSANLVYQVIMI